VPARPQSRLRPNDEWRCFRQQVWKQAARREAEEEDQVSLLFLPPIASVCAVYRTSRRGFPAQSPHHT